MSKYEILLERILNEVETQMRKNKMEGFKIVIKNLDKNAMKALDEAENLWEKDTTSKEMREKFHLLRHYLDYMRRLCKGEA